MTNITQLKRDALSARVTGWQGEMPTEAPTLEDATAMLRKMTLTPEDCMVLLNVISGNLCDQQREMISVGISASFPRRVMLAETARLLDDCADEISNVPGVTV